MVLRPLIVLLSLFFEMTSAAVCPYQKLNLFYYTGAINVDGSGMDACSDEYYSIGAFFDSEFDYQVSEIAAVGAIELDTVVCAIGDYDARRKLEKEDRRLQGGFWYNPGGGCTQCPPDDDDDDRRSLVSFEDSKSELESALSNGLEIALLTTYISANPGSCVGGLSDVSVTVTLTETSASVAEDPNICGHETYCCAPKGDVQFDCLTPKNDNNHSTRWCHQEKWRCDECNGYWVDAANPPTCTSFWSTCDLANDNCCEGSACQGNQYYSQCNPV